ncbi:MAG TPA: UvrD-helicase domain-containing protein, partial [Candidatus Saccharimonadales bacterium]|nr:UvrD-helicase domain-containing protein [Candidatus Saccharimonadales bacterium]
MLDKVLAELNDEQTRAVETTDGPLLILAGAGSGKTKTLTHRVAYILIKKLARPEQILAVTFTNKAASEMRSRIASLLGQNSANRAFMPFMGTFHSICVRILRQDGEHIGIPRNFVIFDEHDRLSAVKQASRELLVDEKSFPPRVVASIISSAKNELITPSEISDVASSPAHRTTAKIYPVYERILKNASALDFDDLIGRTVALLKSNNAIREKWRSQFRYVLIDEYQDTNAAQYELIKLLANPSPVWGSHLDSEQGDGEERTEPYGQYDEGVPQSATQLRSKNNGRVAGSAGKQAIAVRGPNLAVVGDDWQSIYSWRGADYRNILNFEKDYPECTIIKLEQNYRSTKHILDGAHAVITNNLQRSEKKLWTAKSGGLPIQLFQVANERAEGQAIVRQIQFGLDGGKRYGDFAILYRTNAQSRSLEEALLRRNVPYRIVGGVRFYDRAEIKDILAYLRLLYQPEDQISFERIVNVPTRGVGSTSLAKFVAWRQSQGLSLQVALDTVQSCPGLSPKAQQALFELAELLTSLRNIAADSSVPGLLDSLIRRLNYYQHLDDGTPKGESRQENVKELISVAEEYNELGF